MSDHTCPGHEELKAFAIGDLSAAHLARIADHVAACHACETALQAYDTHDDDLLSGLRHLPAPATADAAPPQELLTIARSAAAPAEISTDTGRRFARQLAEGQCRLGKFELQAELGSGAFGYVFRAHDTELDRTVAVKIQRAGALADDEEANRFLREARSAAQLKHPGIVSVYEFGQTEEGVGFLVSEFIVGQTLEVRLRSGPQDPRRAAELTARVAEALQYAHDRGVIHRDIKPSNILIDEKDEPHLMDFGLAKRETGEITMTSDGRVMGTPAYMSPEQARGESHKVDGRSDVYSLGVILYEMLTGERPFQGNRRLLLLQVLEDEPRPPRKLRDQIPRDLETICLKAMAKSPGRRYATARDLADDLRRFVGGKPIQARPVGTPERLARWCRRNPLAATLLLAVSLGSAAGFWHLSALSTYFVRETALDSTRMEIEMLEEVSNFYSELVDDIDWGKTKGIDVTPEYKRPEYKKYHLKNQGRYALPLPATFFIDAGQRISKADSGVQVRLYSDHPFRKDGGPKNDFEQKALEVLSEKAHNRDPDLTFYEFTEVDGRPSLRFAKGQLMRQSCLQCHNHMKESPKKDWREGDLVGVLVITRPLDRDIARTQEGLQGAFQWMGVVALLFVGLCLGFLVRARVQSSGKA